MDDDGIAFAILRRNINRKIATGFNRNTTLIAQQRLNDISFNDLRQDVSCCDISYKYDDESQLFYNEYLAKFWRNILDETTINGFKFLVHISVDSRWIVHCLAEYAESMNDWITAAVSYSKCKEWNKVHQILMDNLFMDWMFDDKIDAQLINTLKQLDANKHGIGAKWMNNGAILLKYIELMKSIQNEQQNSANNHLDNMQNCDEIETLKYGINKMLQDCDEHYLKKRVCLITMLQRIRKRCLTSFKSMYFVIFTFILLYGLLHVRFLIVVYSF
eukprot:TRINITY_DN916_c0_g1_i1.p1 TRINITY_DN916_c0_g1~~TRINITY_DN916_c0_g1_i1.p1  ORF type:complete len:274 (-),score=96.93 TRINITY_DN916_c0_g1_i1:168-989(-)